MITITASAACVRLPFS